MDDEIQKIITNLDNYAVPGEGLSWNRIFLFAESLNSYVTVAEKAEKEKPTWVKDENGKTSKDRFLEGLKNPKHEIAADPDFTGAFSHVKSKSEEKVNPLPDVVLSSDQEKAWKRLQVWAVNKEPYFTLRGYAGTGKSFLLKMLTSLPVEINFTAPTNKATKVLSKFVGQPAKTTFSQLGLRMSQEDDNLVMEYGSTTPYLPRNSILVVDEASMVGKELCAFIEDTRKRSGSKVLYVGDPVQLPPVGENFSKSWKMVKEKENYCAMKKVMRYDNQLLVLATRIRDQMIAKDYSSWPIEDDNDDKEGVFVLHSKKALFKKLKEYTKPEDFLNRKIIAWRNTAVNSYNEAIRANFGFADEYNIGDVILISEPVEKDEVVIAHIDDEFTIINIMETEVKTSGDVYVPVYSLSIMNEDISIVINVVKDEEILNQVLTEKATWAKACKGLARKDAWKDFWTTKKLFCRIRYGYAITAHRSQGSSYDEVFVDQMDILSNKNKAEAYRCLYVSVTRARRSVYTF